MDFKADLEKQLDWLYSTVMNSPEKDLEKIICKKLDKCGLMYRTFSRTKEKMSVVNKIERKRNTYLKEKKKMQDIVGIRIVLYFKDDIDICIDILRNLFQIDNFEYDKPDAETFKPQRINYVFKMPETIMKIPNEMSEECLIDNTFEVQIRTIFSEGWHEVEHDIRYKYSDKWVTAADLSRELNGVLATLELCDQNIMLICEQLAARKYREKDWDSMLRNKLRLRLTKMPLNKHLCDILSKNAQLAKALYRFERKKIIKFLTENTVPKSCDNIVYIINEIYLLDKSISQITPKIITDKCNEWIKRVKLYNESI